MKGCPELSATGGHGEAIVQYQSATTPLLDCLERYVLLELGAKSWDDDTIFDQ